MIKQMHHKHGLSHHPLYKVWAAMRERCNSTKNHAYSRYGGRGISVCARWASFAEFLADIGERPNGMQLDRIDNNGNYEPSNCRWVESRINNRNRRDNRMLTLDDKTCCVAEWAQRLSIPKGTLFWRIRAGWSIKETLMGKTQRGKRNA